ncbi:DnaD domain protein [Miniphocaeibacter massiliensis]|uniref:DnaD domain protein n=1 Tax=Miniphocaeibacter massiliensis TaxID=2041841 RepID=UPI000C0799BD|nr:DnaD domain protein [Miniphocaeibacter massiliensis]
MKFSIDTFTLDLGETPIENLFLDLLMPMADGNAVKVYLYLYRQVLSNNNYLDFNEDKIAKNLGMDTEEFNKAIEYWMETGVISRELVVKTGKYDYKFLSIRELQLGRKSFYEYDRNEENFLNKDNSQEMFNKIEEIIELPLSSTNIIEILELQKSTNVSSDLIIKAFEYSKKKTGKMNFNYVFGIIRNWYLDGIKTLDDYYKLVENEQIKKANIKKKRKYYKPESKEKKELDVDFKENSAELESIRKLIAQRKKDE